MKLSQLPLTDTADEMMVNVAGVSHKITMASFAASMWDNMYVHAQKVIVPCRYCHSHNAVSNSNCVSCGAPMGA